LVTVHYAAKPRHEARRAHPERERVARPYDLSPERNAASAARGWDERPGTVMAYDDDMSSRSFLVPHENGLGRPFFDRP
jgi:hypothetical protein